MLRRLLAYAFPFFLLGLEAIIRAAMAVDVSYFIGPALASGAAGLCVPLLSPRDRSSILPADLQEALKAANVTAIGKRERILSDLAPFLLFGCIGLWAWTVVLAERKDPVLVVGMQRSFFIGLCTYLAAAIAVEVKEQI